METAKILEKYAPQFVALDEAEREATPLNFNSAEIEEKFTYECPLCEGGGEVEAKQYINFDNLALNMCFSGIGDSVHKDQRFVEEARNQARALLDAYAEALVKLQEQDWQPIETAPKDGQEVLLGFWHDLEDKGNNPAPLVASWSKYRGYWYVVGPELEIATKPGPTHWRPIPAPPKREEPNHEAI